MKFYTIVALIALSTEILALKHNPASKEGYNGKQDFLKGNQDSKGIQDFKASPKKHLEE